MPSPFIYINSALPTEYAPPTVVASEEKSAPEITALISSNDVELGVDRDAPVDEAILSIFEGAEVRFGAPELLDEHRSDWLERIRVFTERGETIPFVAMAFPYKSPNPLKTHRAAPDAGEALMLRRFQAVLDAIGSVYEPGGRLTILEEGILGRCQGVDPRSIAAYRAGIPAVVEAAGIGTKSIEFHSLDDMTTEIDNFEARWIFEQERLRDLYHQGDPATVTSHDVTSKAQRASVPTWDYEPELLAHAYDATREDSELRYVRDYVDKVSHRQFFAYRSLLTLRDVTGYLSRLRPGALKLTVSPKVENLAVLPVNRWATVLPYHGVPVLHVDGTWSIEYEGGLGTTSGDLVALRLASQDDPAPFAYREVE